MSQILQVFCILFSAALLSLGIPNELYNLGSPIYGLLSLVPFCIAARQFRSFRQSALMFALHTFTVHLLSSFWLAFFKDFAAFTLGASAVGTGCIGFAMGLVLHLPFSRKDGAAQLEDMATCHGAPSVAIRVLWFPAVYTTYEWVKSVGFLGYPWGTLSSTMFNWKVLIQIADITGTYGVTFLCAALASLIAEGLSLLWSPLRTENARFAAAVYAQTACCILSLLACTFVYGAFRLIEPNKPEKYINAIMVQQNADPWKAATDNDTILASQRLTTERLEEARRTGTEVDLVIWSEGCLKSPYPRYEYHYKKFPEEKPLSSFISECNVPFILGGSYVRDKTAAKSRRIYNAALLFDRNGNFRGWYGKNHLVPMAESIPFSGIPAVAQFLKSVIHISAGFTAGDQYTYFEIPAHYAEPERLPATAVISLKDSYSPARKTERPYVRISTPICFDDSFPDVCRPLTEFGSEAFINITDDSWSSTKSAEYQHFVISAFRTIELRTAMARSCNSGYSVVLDSKGNVISDQRLFEESAALVKIPVYRRKSTVYLRLGNWLPHALAWLCIAVIAYFYATLNRDTLVRSERKKFMRKRHKKGKRKTARGGRPLPPRALYCMECGRFVSQEGTDIHNYMIFYRI